MASLSHDKTECCICVLFCHFAQDFPGVGAKEGQCSQDRQVRWSGRHPSILPPYCNKKSRTFKHICHMTKCGRPCARESEIGLPRPPINSDSLTLAPDWIRQICQIRSANQRARPPTASQKFRLSRTRPPTF